VHCPDATGDEFGPGRAYIGACILGERAPEWYARVQHVPVAIALFSVRALSPGVPACDPGTDIATTGSPDAQAEGGVSRPVRVTAIATASTL